MNLLSEHYNNSINIIQLDNGAIHKAKKLTIPSNIILLFQPPYSRELNPIERVWQYIKERLSWGIYKKLEDLQQDVRNIVNNLEDKIVASLTGWDYIIEALSVALL